MSKNLMSVMSFLSKENFHQITNEDTNDIEHEGVAIREKEHVVFARIINFAQLKNASSAEIQEQYGIYVEKTDKNASSGQIRVRKIIQPNGESRYELTVKNKAKDGKIECTIETTQVNFTQFKALSEQGMLKHRYCFPIKGTDLKWEIDAVPDGNGGYYPWVRCEIEVKDLKSPIPTLPIETEEVIMPWYVSNETEEAYKGRTEPLMERFFTKPNPYLTQDSNTATELSVSQETPSTNIKEESVEKSEDKSADNTTGEETLSIDNISDDKEKADLVEKRAEQIKEKKDNGSEENLESEETEFSKESFTSGAFLPLQGKVDVEMEIPQDDKGFERDLNALQAARDNIEAPASERSAIVAFQVLFGLYYRYTGIAEEIDESNYKDIISAIYGKIAQLSDIDTEEMSREQMIHAVNEKHLDVN